MSERIIIDEEVPYDGKCMVCETDTSGKIVFANRCFLDNMGYDKNEIVDQSFELIRHPDVPDTMLAKMWAVLQQRETWMGYVKLLTKEGKYIWVSVYFTPKENDDGHLTGYAAAFSKAEASMIKQTEKLFAQAKEDPNSVDALVANDKRV